MDRKIILGTKCVRKKKIYKYNVEYNIEEKKKKIANDFERISYFFSKNGLSGYG